jgi:cell wall-associated NlpC family hydrolase
MSWAARWVGVPWAADGQGCWRLACQVWRTEFGWNVPDVPVAADPRAERRALAAGCASGDWVPVLTARDGDAVLMAARREPCHVGVYVAPGRVLHAVRGEGAVCVPLARLPVQGFRVVGFWRWKGAA